MDFDTLNKISVNDKTEKKGQFTYLSWAWAWAEFVKNYPTATYQILEDKIYQDGTMEVRVAVMANDISHTMWLPVMDNKNKAISNPNAMDINKARMRCLVKCLAMFGLGLYIYAGEDLPEGEAYTPEQKSRFDLYMNNEDDLRLYLFTKSLDESVITALYNSFESGEKTAKKKLCNELSLKGNTSAREIVSTVTTLINNSDPDWSMHLEGLEPDEKKILAGMFDKDTLDKMRKMGESK